MSSSWSEYDQLHEENYNRLGGNQVNVRYTVSRLLRRKNYEELKMLIEKGFPYRRSTELREFKTKEEVLKYLELMSI